MTNLREIAGDINAYVGSAFEVALEAQTGSTGYSWGLAHMPDSIILIDIRHEIAHSAIRGSSSRQVFVFAAVKKDQSYITFDLIRPWEPCQPVSEKTFALIIVDKPKNLEVDLEATIGADKFMKTKADQNSGTPFIALYAAPPIFPNIMPYGFPLGVVEHPEKCLLAYGTPGGVATDPSACVLKYGFPVHMMDDQDNCHPMYGYPVVKYGSPVMKYGFPVHKDGVLQVEASEERCHLLYGCPVEIINDPEKCVLKYGFPNSGAAYNFPVKYGCPVEVKEDADNCVIKYGIPTGVAADMESCIIKYGFPVSVEDNAAKCIIYGATSPDLIKE